MTFRSLHQSSEPLLLCNVWDVASAKIAAQLGYRAIGTSSAAIATSAGKADGEQLAFDQLCDLAAKISTATNLPLTVDIEAGYSRDSGAIADNIAQLATCGAVGINLEDSLVTNGERQLRDRHEFARQLQLVSAQLKDRGIDIFVNVRTDTYLLGIAQTLEETLERIRLYQAAGADGIFVPCLKHPSDIRAVVNASELPLNLMCVPGLPDMSRLAAMGVRRISMGNFVHEAMLGSLTTLLTTIKQERSFSTLFDSSQPR